MNPLFLILLMAAIGTIPVLTASIARRELASEEDVDPNSTRNILIGISSALALLTLIARVMFLLRRMRRREAAEARAAKDVSRLLGPSGSTSASSGMVSGTHDGQHSPYAAVECKPQRWPSTPPRRQRMLRTRRAVLPEWRDVLAASDPTHDSVKATQQLVLGGIEEKNPVRAADSNALPGYNER